MKVSDLIELCVVSTGSEKKYELWIDGAEFPWHTTGGVTTTVTGDSDFPTLTLTIPTVSLKITHRVD